jgi:hypothetical protein
MVNPASLKADFQSLAPRFLKALHSRDESNPVQLFFD